MRHSATGLSRSRERGATAVFVALTLLVITGFLALAINAGHLYSVRGELQNGADSAALAGAVDLNFQTAPITGSPNPVTVSAQKYANYHHTDAPIEANQVVGDPIQLGHWPLPGEANTCADGEAEAGTAKPPDYSKFCKVTATDAAAAQRINAVRVATARAADALGGGAAPVFMNGILGASSTSDVRTEAVAVAGGPCSNGCGKLPFVLQEGCVLGKCPAGGFFYVQLSSDTVDTAGFTSLVPAAGVSAGDICDILNGTTCEKLDWGNQIYTSNGAPWGGPCNICQTLQAKVGNAAGTAKVPLVTYPGDTPTTCDDTKWNQTATVQTFATVKIVLAQCKKTDPPVWDHSSITVAQRDEMLANCYPPPTPGGGGPPPQVCVVTQLMCDVDDKSPGGCAYAGTLGTPRLVR